MTSRLIRTVSSLSLAGIAAIGVGSGLFHFFNAADQGELVGFELDEKQKAYLSGVDDAITRSWDAAGISPTPQADTYTIARRLSLALTGAPPSVEELRMLDALPEGANVTQAWLTHLFADPRYHSYVAERLTRAFVGVETGPFLVYRRRRLVNWLRDQLEMNRPYDQIVRNMIAAEGLWTSHPGANFITVAVDQNGNGSGPDEVKLAGRTTRAFLGFSLDCVECHDDKFGDRWKQADFHQLAAFFAQAEMRLTGVQDNRSLEYEARYLGETEETVVPAMVPYASDLKPDWGNRRKELAHWVTHRENRAFSRAATNRFWALLFGRALVTPVDDIPLEGPYPAGLEEVAALFVESRFNVQALIRIVAETRAFQRSSLAASPEVPVTQEQEAAWAAFPITPLRSEQVAGGVVQSSSLQAIDRDAHFFEKLRRFGETNDFVKRFGDQGESEFVEEAGTVPQRLLLMNGKLVSERTKPNPITNSATRLASYATDDEAAVEVAFLATLTRLPTGRERVHFSNLLESKSRKHRETAMEDIYWALINSTEFSWNR